MPEAFTIKTLTERLLEVSGNNPNAEVRFFVDFEDICDQVSLEIDVITPTTIQLTLYAD